MALVDHVPIRIDCGELNFRAISLAAMTNSIVSDVPSRWARVVTPNIHHFWILSRTPSLFEIYQSADYLLADGWPVARLLSWLSKQRVPRLAGSDLLDNLIVSEVSERSLVLVGGSGQDPLNDIASRARAAGWNVTTRIAAIEQLSDEVLRKSLLREVAVIANGGVVAIGVGAPKQELIAHELAQMEGCGWILCVGMAINYSGGSMRRAPRWMRNSGLEWLHRVLSEPRRLVPRYLGDVSAFVNVIRLNIWRCS